MKYGFSVNLEHYLSVNRRPPRGDVDIFRSRCQTHDVSEQLR